MLFFSCGVREVIDDTAVFHDVVTVGHGRGEAEILLDQQDGEALRLERADGVADLLDDDRAPGPRSARRAATAARRCVECGRSPASAARRRTVSCPGFSAVRANSGNSAKMRSRSRPPGRTCGGSNRFSLTSRLEKIPRSSGQKAMPARAITLEASLVSSRPSKRTEPVRFSTMPMIALSVVVLPTPLRPSSVTTSPACTSKVTPCSTWNSPYQASRLSTARSALRLRHGWSQDGRSRDRLRAPPDPPTPSCSRPRPARGRG